MCASKYPSAQSDSGVFSPRLGDQNLPNTNAQAVAPFNYNRNNSEATGSDGSGSSLTAHPPQAPTSETGDGQDRASPVFYVVQPIINSIRSRELDEARSRIIDLKATVSETEVKAQRLQTKLDEVILEKGKIEVQLKRTEDEYRALSESKDSAVSKMRSTIEELQKRLAAKESENETQREKYENEIASLKEQLEKSEEKYNKKELELSREIFELKLNVKDHIIEEEGLKRKILEVTCELQKVDSELKLKKMEEERAKIEDERAKMEQERAKMEQERARMADEHAKMEEERVKEKAESDAEIAKLERMLSEKSFQSQKSSDSECARDKA